METVTLSVEFKDPDFAYNTGLSEDAEDKLRSFGEHGEYFSLELEVNENAEIVAARFVK